jgi:CheY-like chemotaxis protein
MAKILVVEDNDVLRRAYTTILTTQGYEVAEAADGQSALEKAREWEPDLILLDILMPIIDGLEFLRQYKPTEHPNVKIIVFSNSQVPHMISQAVDLGAKKYLIKANISPKEMLETVETELRG